MSKPDALIVFGDSLSDHGEIFDLTAAILKQPIPPTSAGYNGWFSNGLVQSGVTAVLLDVPAEFYAIGSARAVGSRTIAEYMAQNGYNTPEIMLPNPDPIALATDMNLGGQVGRFLFDAATTPPAPGTAAAFWFGANDYNALPADATPELVAQTVTAVVGTTVGAALAVAQTGIETVYLYNLPAPGFLPIPTPPALDLVIAGHNNTLARGVAFLASQGVDAQIIDMNRIADEITADVRTFGLNPAYLDAPLVLGIGSQPTWNPVTQDWEMLENAGLVGVNPATVAYMDFLHPSSATHGILGSFAAASMAGNPVFLGDGNDKIRTGPRDDLVLGGAGNDRIFAQGGADIVLAGLGKDLVLGGSGRDILAGGAGNDVVNGEAGNDVVAGSDGNDRQYGGLGNDLMVDGLGFDRIHGGAARDVFLYTEASFLGGTNATDGGVFYGDGGIDTLYLAVDAGTRAEIRADLRPGAATQHLGSIGVTAHSIERYVFVDPFDPAAHIVSGAPVAQADLWGII